MLNPSTILAAMSQRGRRTQHGSIPAVASRRALTRPPRIEVELLREVSRSADGFLQVRELELRSRFEDGAVSEPYRYFMVERTRLDAVAIVLYRRGESGIELVLRSQLRPPLAFRQGHAVPLPETEVEAVQWELPAGLVEPGDQGFAGLAARASAETHEEVGVVLGPERFRPLGPPSALTPGVIAEKMHFVCAEILATDEWHTAEGDGLLESHSVSVFVTLATALQAIDDGVVHDIKTEVGIRRLAASSLHLHTGEHAESEREQA
jgi:ADP-ribose pyrophosphatase